MFKEKKVICIFIVLLTFFVLAAESVNPTELYSCSVENIYDDFGDIISYAHTVKNNSLFECSLKLKDGTTSKLKYDMEFSCDDMGFCSLCFNFYNNLGKLLDLDYSWTEYKISIKSSSLSNTTNGVCKVEGTEGKYAKLVVDFEQTSLKNVITALFSNDFKVVINESYSGKTYSLGKVNTEGLLKAFFGNSYSEGIKLNSEGKYSEAIEAFESIFNKDFCSFIPEYNNARVEHLKSRLGKDAQTTIDLYNIKEGRKYLLDPHAWYDNLRDDDYINYGMGVKCFYEEEYGMACYYFGLCNDNMYAWSKNFGYDGVYKYIAKKDGVREQIISLYNEGKYYEALFAMVFFDNKMLKEYFPMFSVNDYGEVLASIGGFIPYANIDGGLLFITNVNTSDPINWLYQRYPERYNNLKYKKKLFALTVDEDKKYRGKNFSEYYSSKGQVVGFVLDVAAYNIH